MNDARDPTVIPRAHALFYTENKRADAFALLAGELARFPEHEEAEGFLAFLYATEGRYLDALRLFTRLIERNPQAHYLSNILFCRTAAATNIMEGRPLI